MANIHCQLISPKETLPLRHSMLRAGSPLSACCWTGDNLSSTYHFGLVDPGHFRPVDPGSTSPAAILGIASLYHRATEIAPGDRAWQLRGMAVLPERRNQGLGTILLEHIVRYCKHHLGGETIWCNAREVAVGFYRRHGFAVASEAFEIEDVGQHFLMRRDL